jgi:D-alanyl-D-alanine carboxypeptidase (penicillin-binding protein 5/6)
VIAAQNADERRDPASLTKLMTAYLAFGALRDKTLTPSQAVNVSETAWRAEGSRTFIEPRRAVSVDELLRGMIVQSGNDASVALAELVSGTEAAFAERMNLEAKRLGLSGSHFVNATGLSDPQHYSTANDLARLAEALIRDFPGNYPLYALKEYRYNNITQPNRNRLLWIDPYVDGVKTGHTDAAGWCLIASAKRGERRLLSVVLGAASDAVRASESQKLLNYGFQAYDTVQLYQAGKPVSSLRVWKGAAPDVGAGFLADQYLTLPKGKAAKLELTLAATEPLVAPIGRGQRIGTVRVALEGKVLGEFPLLALADVPLANLLGRAWDSVRLWFK